MKLTFKVILCILIFILTTVYIPSVDKNAKADDSDIEYGYIIANDVNFRAEPSADSLKLATLPLQSRLEIISYENDWYHAIYEGVIGYVRQDYVFVSSSSTRTAYSNEDNVKLRGGPDTSTYVVLVLSAGQPVKVRDIVGEWYYTIVGNEAGYIHRSYLTMSKPGSVSLERMLKVGMEGQEVTRLQTELYERGFLSIVDITGFYGSRTRQAVREFQEACGIDADGIAGDATLDLVYDENNTVTHDNAMFNMVRGTVELLDWNEGGSSWLGRGAYFVITDVRTGLSFNARRFGGWLHADSEPVTAEDTVIMKEISGGSWSWNRRPIWITYNGRTVAASMHTMPHMANPTKSNNFDGHFCIHLLGSKVHATERECPRHQACVIEAYEAGRSD